MNLLTRPALVALAAPLFTLSSAADAAVVTTGCGGGDTCTMTQLTSGGTITAGSLRFHSFSVLADAGSATIDENTISLTGLDDAGIVLVAIDSLVAGKPPPGCRCGSEKPGRSH